MKKFWGTLFVLMVIVAGTTVYASRYMWGEAEIVTVNGTDMAGWGRARMTLTGLYEIAIPGTSLVNTGLQVEAWLDGAQNHLNCGNNSSLNSSYACQKYLAEADEAIATWGYRHPTFIGGTWCAHERTWGWSTTTDWVYGGDWYGCANVSEDPPDDFCDAGYYYDGLDCIPIYSPIIMPLTQAQNYKLTSAINGVYFDIDADGVVDRVSWTTADAELGFLAIDRNGNGLIDNGSELFGNFTIPGVQNGFLALAQLEPQATDDHQTEGGPGWISDRDPIYSKLLLWQDRNHNGVSEVDELQPLSNLYTRIGLGYVGHDRRDGHGNRFMYRGFAEYRTAPGRNRSDGSNGGPGEQFRRQRDIYDIALVKQQ